MCGVFERKEICQWFAWVKEIINTHDTTIKNGQHCKKETTRFGQTTRFKVAYNNWD